MKTTIFALSLAAIAATAGATGASATFYGNGESFRPSRTTIDEATTAYRIDRRNTVTPDSRWRKGDDGNKRSWYANRGWCSNNPDSGRCQGGSR